MNIIPLRREYAQNPLHKEDLDPNPFKQFEIWFNNAIDAQIIEANAMSLATVDASARPSIRTVLLKLFDEKGFVFFTNYNSDKAHDISENPNVALEFLWLDLERQIKNIGNAIVELLNINRQPLK